MSKAGIENQAPVAPTYNAVSGKAQSSALHANIARLFRAINFNNEQTALVPQNIEATCDAIKEFNDAEGLILAQTAFEHISENCELPPFRDDNKTPAWYHQARQVFMFLSLIYTNQLSEEVINQHGGMNVATASIWLHDELEDTAKTKAGLYQLLVEPCEQKLKNSLITPEYYNTLLHRSSEVVSIVDLASRKKPKRDAEGNVIRNAAGKIVTEDRFGGDPNAYRNNQLFHPQAVLNKFLDDGENGGTVIMEDTLARPSEKKFSVDRNIKFARSKRSSYGAERDTAGLASQKWPEYASAYRCADGMVGSVLTGLELFNSYFEKDSKLNPANAQPMSNRYVQSTYDGFYPLPHAWRPDMIGLGRQEKIAEFNKRARLMLSCAVYPTMRPLMDSRAMPIWYNSENPARDCGFTAAAE